VRHRGASDRWPRLRRHWCPGAPERPRPWHDRELATTLPVQRGLRCQLIELGAVAPIVQHRIARRVLVDARGTMADPLSRDEDRQLHVQLDLAHLEGRGVPVPHQVADQALVGRHLLGALAVGHPCRLNHGGIVAHVVDHPDEPLIEDGQGLEQQLLDRRHDGPARRLLGGAKLGDFGQGIGGQGHAGYHAMREGRDVAVVQLAPLSERGQGLYTDCRSDPAMVINATRHKRIGPGGSTRRLHQTHRRPSPGCRAWSGIPGGETGSTSVVKGWFLPGMVPPLPDHHDKCQRQPYGSRCLIFR
jgi:hypothetical protein